ncbi:membrane protein, putative [Candidatus Vecturithrix granuli]|uniref:Membrane protein, putative n=1 Tax=Vecturithrix granuli TaxID=1499967 RepID=A0A081BWF1_VECG1|nr:membrane protein, putative [Candidatus Vecturithrix granuli]
MLRKGFQSWFTPIRCGVILGILTVSITLFAFQAAADEHPILYLFWGNGCPHCAEEKEFLAMLREQYPELEMRFFEVWDHPQFATLGEALAQAYQIQATSVPLTFLGDYVVVGFRSWEETGMEIDAQVQHCLQQGCPDALDKVASLEITARIRAEVAEQSPTDWQLFAPVLAAAPPTAETTPEPAVTPKPFRFESEVEAASEQAVAPRQFQLPPMPDPVAPPRVAQPDPNAITVPLIGTITVSQIGLPLFTIFIGGLDGFNPCAMWVLCFLLSLVIYAKSRAKILMIGGIFVIASGVIYFLFMAAWLNLFLFVGYVKALRIAVGVVAVVMGLINCKDFFFFKKGVSLTIPESAQPKLFKKMRDVVHTAALPGMIAGTIALAVTANLIELLCTAGFPAIYTRILTLQNLSAAHYYLYLVFYNVVYVIPLAVIVGVFAWKMGGRKLSEKEGRILKLIGGVLMLVLGLILLIKPQLLMFG